MNTLTRNHIFCIITVMTIGFYFQLISPLNHDIGWILYGAKIMLSGAEFGKDIIEPNPPLIQQVVHPNKAKKRELIGC